MPDVTRILSEIEHGDLNAAEQFLPLVYDELRKLAAVKMAQERPGHTLQATALVHEAYMRLVDGEQACESRLCQGRYHSDWVIELVRAAKAWMRSCGRQLAGTYRVPQGHC